MTATTARPWSAAPVLDLSFLRTFLAIYRRGSLTHAAHALHLTQPAVSQHLKALEAQLGRPLFTRHRWGVRPTPAAHELARQTAPHLDALDLAASTLGPNPEHGFLRLGGPPDLLATLVVDALAPAPHHLSLHPGIASDLTRLLASGELDALLTAERSGVPELDYEPLFQERLVLVVSAARAARLPRRRGRALTEALARGPFVAFRPEMHVVRRFFRVLLDRELDEAPTLILPDQRGLAAAIAAGPHVGVLPHLFVEHALATGALVAPLSPLDAQGETLYLAARRGLLSSPRFVALRERLVQAVRARQLAPAPGSHQ